jgi:hypothetical protein
MTKELQHRRGTSAEHAAFKGAPGEITVDTNKFVAVVHDNQTFGGHELVGVAATQTVRSKTIIAGSATSTGTASQPLQVFGGAYVSGNLGIGTTNPSDVGISVLGKVQINQNSSSDNRIVFRGQPNSLYRWNIDNYGSTNQFRIFKEDDLTAANGMSHFIMDPNGNLFLGAASATGTANQRLQVSSGGYFSNSVGIGTTNPTSAIHVNGDSFVTGISSSNTFRARGGAPGALGVNNNGYGFFGSGDNDSGMYSSADGQLEFYSNSGEVARIAAGGNIGIGSTNPDAKLIIVGPGGSGAGTAPIKVSVASTVLLATPEAGAFEYDRVLLYHTNHDTTNANKRALIPEVQFIRRPDNLSITATTTPGTSFFGATNRPALLGGYIYEIEAIIFVTKVTNAGTITVQAALSTGNFTFATLQSTSATNAIVVGGTTSPVSIFTSASLTATTSHGFTIRGLVQPASNSRFDLLLFSSATSTTALANSYLKVTCVGTGGPIGNIA